MLLAVSNFAWLTAEALWSGRELLYGASFSLTAALTEIWRHADGRYDPVVVSALFRVLRAPGAWR